MHPTSFVRIAMVALVVAVGGSSTPASAAPKLAVVVVFDQMGTGTLDRLAPLFGRDGFGGLMGRGAARWDVFYASAAAETAPGHATIATGADPDVHGVPLNGWFKDGRYWFSVRDDAERIVGAPIDEAHPRPGVSARVLRAPTLGDTLKTSTLGRGRVVSISLKDRAAILSGGRSADVALFFDPAQGGFTTTTAIASALPAWADDLASRLPRESLERGTWAPLVSTEVQRTLIPNDDVEGEGEGEAFGFDRAFPHDLAALANTTAKDRKTKARAYRGTPQAMNDLFTLAQAAVQGEQLGQDTIPDLLVVSISTTDYVGHWWGPNSAEAVDIYRRADAALRDFLSYLDRQVGRGHYVVAVTADHGASPVPERVKSFGVDAGRLRIKTITSRVDVALQAFGPRPKLAGETADTHANDDVESRVLGFVSPHLFLSLDDLSPQRRHAALAAARNAVLTVDGVAAAYRVENFDEDADAHVDAYRASVVPGRSGSIVVRPLPYWVFTGRYETGVTHGSDARLDREVPLFLLGPRVQRGRREASGFARDIAPTMARALGIPIPAGATGRVLEGAFRRPLP